MFSKKSFVGAMVLAAAVVFSGCVDNQIPEETGLNNIPGAAGDPRNAGMSTGDTLGFDAVPGEDGWAAGADEGSIAGGALHDAGWPVVEGIEFPIIYFDFDRDEIRPSEREAIQQVANYMNTYPELGLIIEGHTDTQGTYLVNLELSQERALSVATYCLQMPTLSEEQLEKLREILTAKGRSYSDPIYNEDGTINMDASRRVEFKFRMKDSEMIDEIRNILGSGVNQ